MSQRGYFAIGLLSPKDSNNVGSVLRAAGCYGAAFVATTGTRYKKAATDPAKMVRHLPLIQCKDLHEVIPYNCVPVAVEFIETAISLVDYVHPERAFYIFGPEDGTLGEKTLSWCRDVIYVPTHYCMNLAAAANVILYDRLAKSGEQACH